MKKLLLLCLYLLGGLLAYSQPGTLDSTFAGRGWTYTDFAKSNNLSESGLQVLRQTDGSYILLLNAASGTVLTRYLSDGTLDKSYGMEGFSQVGGLSPVGAALQSDGKIVVAGSRYTSVWKADFALIRYNGDGSIDTGFGTGGVATTDFYGSSDEPRDMALQPDGKIVVAGYASGLQGNDFALARYYPDGALDRSFGSGGKVTTDFGAYDYAVAVALQPDGKIVVAGTSSGEAEPVFALARYNPDGSLDPGLDGDGKLTSGAGEGRVAGALALQSDGKLVVGGFAMIVATGNDFVLARYNSDGSPDNSFGGDGQVVTDFFGSWDYGSSMVLQTDGKIVVAGSAGNPGTNSTGFALARYGADGSLDNSFGAEGKVFTGFLGQDGAGFVSLQEDGKLVVIGTTEYPDSYISDFALARYNSDGSPDLTFSGDGKLTGYYPVAFSANNALAVQEDGKVVVAGRANRELSDASDFGVARYNSDGAPDTVFGPRGSLATDFYGYEDEAKAVAVQPDGKIVVAGWATDNSGTIRREFALARYHTDGVLDSSFDGDGKVTTAFGEFSSSAASVAVQEDGKIVVAGTTQHPGSDYSDFALVRYNEDGSLDHGFGEGGKVTTDFWGANDVAYALAIQPDGKLLVAGAAANPGARFTGFALARYTAEGLLDPSFGEGGKVTTDFGSWSGGQALAIQPDGKLVVAGQYGDPVTHFPDFAVARYYPNGMADSSFDGDGRLTASFRDFDWPSSLALQGDGRIIVAGQTRSNTSDNLDVLLYRINVDGTPDTTFGERGMVVRDFGITDFANAAAVRGSRLYVAGARYHGTDRGILAAYRTGCGEAEICGNRVDDNCDGQVDEGCPAQPFLTINDVTVSEDLQRATLMVTLSKKVDQAVSVSYFTVDRTATSKPNKKEERDYTAQSGTLTIGAGQQTAVIGIDIIRDNNTEGEEYFDVHLQRPVNAALAGDKGRVTIQDGTPSVGIFVTVPVLEKEILQKLSATARPNPSAGAFTLVLQSSDRSPVVIKVTDATGRLVEAKAGITPNSTLQIGSNYRPGVYYAEVVQGSERVNLKLVKQ